MIVALETSTITVYYSTVAV